MSDITLKEGEAKTLQFTITRGNSVLDVSSATFTFAVKTEFADTTYLIEKEDADFDKTDAALGVVRVTLTTTDMAVAIIPAENYIAELKIVITAGTDVDKSTTMNFIVEQSVFHD